MKAMPKIVERKRRRRRRKVINREKEVRGKEESNITGKKVMSRQNTIQTEQK